MEDRAGEIGNLPPQRPNRKVVWHCTVVETNGSVWWLDDGDMTYMRLPKSEMPRERAEWSDERAGVLQDAVWHPMTGWRIRPHPAHAVGSPECLLHCPNCPGLRIHYVDADGEEQTTWAPNAHIVRTPTTPGDRDA